MRWLVAEAQKEFRAFMDRVAFNWDGKDLKLKFEVDFFAEKLGRPHHMKFSSPLRKASLDMPRAASR